jgi:hypothetical protein
VGQVKLVGDFRARRISVLVGALLKLTIAYLSIKWIRSPSTASLIAVGFLWLLLTLLFELSLGSIFGLTWERIISDYDLRRGGLLPLGLIVLTISPLVAARLQG